LIRAIGLIGFLTTFEEADSLAVRVESGLTAPFKLTDFLTVLDTLLTSLDTGEFLALLDFFLVMLWV